MFAWIVVRLITDQEYDRPARSLLVLLLPPLEGRPLAYSLSVTDTLERVVIVELSTTKL